MASAHHRPRQRRLAAMCAGLWVSLSGFALAQQENPSRGMPSMELPSIDGIAHQVRALIVPRREATLSSLVAARIDNIAVEDGDRFGRGDILLSFDCAVQSAALQSALAQLKQYELTHAANVDLRKSEAVSKLDLALSEAKIDEGKAEVALARAHLKTCRVRAPFDGRIAKVLANEHETVEVGDPLIEILDDSRLEVTLHMPSRRRSAMSAGARLQIAIDETDKVYEAVVARISPRIDAASRTFEVTAEIVGSHAELVAGMSGIAIFEAQ